MQLGELTIQGLKSFNKKQTLQFYKLQSDGFYYIAGENQIEPELGANGSGKSSLVEALCWLLFGKTSTNLVAGNVANWNNPKCEVEGTIDGHFFKRTWNPNTLSVDGVTVTQEELEKVLGINFESFLYSIFISQFSSKFFDLDPSEKMAVFSEIMDDTVKEWEDYAELCKRESSIIEPHIEAKTLEIAGIESSIRLLENKDYTSLIDDFERDRQSRLNKVKVDIDACYYAIDQAKDKKKGLNELQGFSNLEKELELHKKNIKAQAESITLLMNQKMDLHSNITIKTAHIGKLAGIDSKCPNCLQKVSGAHKSTVVKQLTKELESLEKELNKIDALYRQEVSIKDDWEDKASELEVKITDIKQSHARAKLEIENCDKLVSMKEEQLKYWKDCETKYKSEENPYLKMKEADKDQINILKRDLLYQKDEYKILVDDFNRYDYWAKGFKNVRFLIVEEALKEFEININNNLEKLGMSDWSIVLAVDSLTKKKTVKKGFSVFVKSSLKNELVPFSVWSGGEGQRLRLAGTLGLIDFISDRRGIKSNIEIYDEPTQFLSDVGIEDLLQVLRARAKDLNKMVFLIDHRQLGSMGIFDGTINIVKTTEGSIIEIL